MLFLLPSILLLVSLLSGKNDSNAVAFHLKSPNCHDGRHLSSSPSTFWPKRLLHTSRGYLTTTTSLAFADEQTREEGNNKTKKDNNNNNKKKQKKKVKGVYTRPSAAIEKGSGFFVPGLEGSRVRLLSGSLILLLTIWNRSLLPSSTEDYYSSTSFLFPETVAIFYGFLLLLQAAIEFGKEIGLVGGTTTSSSPSSSTTTTKTTTVLDDSIVEQWSSSSSTLETKEWKERVEWTAASFRSITPCTHLFLIRSSDSEIIYQQLASGKAVDTKSIAAIKACRAAFDSLSKAKTGRISLPSTHPTFVSLSENLLENTNIRCVILQTINNKNNNDDSYCWMVCSDQLLAAYTQQDLKWLGNFANYLTK